MNDNVQDVTPFPMSNPTVKVDRHSVSLASSVHSKAKHKPDTSDRPKRPLNAYNIFFKHQRMKILQATPTRKEGKPARSHGKIGFADLARTIASEWKSVDSQVKALYDQMAADDKERYHREMKIWRAKQTDKARAPGSLQEMVSKDYSYPSFDLQHQAAKRPVQMPSQQSYIVHHTHSRIQPAGMQQVLQQQEFRHPHQHAQGSLWNRQESSNVHEPNHIDAMALRQRPSMTDLASQLGDESLRIFMNAFFL